MRKADDGRTEATLPQRVGIGHARRIAAPVTAGRDGVRAARHRALGALVLPLLVTACSASPTMPPATNGGVGSADPGPSSDPAASASVAPTRTPELLRLALDDAGPIIRPEDGPDWARFALPAAATRTQDGTYVVVVVWFGEADDAVQIGFATSTDTRTWAVGPKPILTEIGATWPNPGPIPSALVELGDGTWQLYGWAAESSNTSFFASWRASAPKLEGPWKLDGEGILGPGRPGTWDSQTAAIGSVQRTDTGYAAWFEGSPPGASIRGDLGLATSADGLAWHKFDDPATTTASLAESDPVIPRGLCGAGTAQAVFQPQVEIGRAGGYLAAFGGFAASREQMDVFGAVSVDGIHWTCGSPEALLTRGGIPNSQGIHTIASMPLGDGRVALLVESLGDGRSDIWLATITQLD